MSIYHKIFVNTSISEDNLHLLSKHMYDYEYLKTIDHDKKEEIKEVIVEEKNDNLINRKDPLFWCIYISVYGYDEYVLLTSGIDNAIINEKQKIGEFFKSNPNIMKNVNMKITKKDIQMQISRIMINEEVDMQMLYAFSIYYKRPIIITNKVSYLKICPDDHNEKYIVIVKTNEGYYLDDKMTYQYIIENYFELYKYNEPLMPISKYKVNELKTLVDTINLQVSNNDKKTIYYEISRYYNWEKN